MTTTINTGTTSRHCISAYYAQLNPRFLGQKLVFEYQDPTIVMHGGQMYMYMYAHVLIITDYIHHSKVHSI